PRGAATIANRLAIARPFHPPSALDLVRQRRDEERRDLVPRLCLERRCEALPRVPSETSSHGRTVRFPGRAWERDWITSRGTFVPIDIRALDAIEEALARAEAALAEREKRLGPASELLSTPESVEELGRRLEREADVLAGIAFFTKRAQDSAREAAYA